MKIKFVKIIVIILIFSLYGLFLVSKITLPGALDLPRQIQNGKDILHGNFDVFTKNVYSYTEPNQPFANHHWLFGVEAYFLYQSIGWVGISIFKILIIFLTFALLIWLVLKRSDFWLVALFSIPTIFIMISRTAFRPEIFSYLFLVLFLILLFDLEKNPNKNRVYLLIPLMLIWVNTHLFFPIGIMIVLGFLFEKFVLNFNEWRSNIIIRKLVILLFGLIVMIFFNPYGLIGVVKSLMVNTNPNFPVYSMEVTTALRAIQSNPGWANISIYIYMFLVVILLICFIGTFIYRLRNKKSLFADNFIFLFLASVGSAGLSYFIFRALPLFGIVFLISICHFCNEFFLSLKEWVSRESLIVQKITKSFSLILFFVLIIFLISIGQTKIMQYQEQGFGLAKDALSSIEFLKNNHLKGPILNDTDSGSYLIGELYPQEKVFTDNRFGDAYSAQFFGEIYIPLIQNEDKWKENLDKYKFNIIFMYHYDQGDGVKEFIYKRIYDPAWVWVYADKYNIILVRNIIENKDVIDKYRITYQNAPERLSYLINSNDARDKMNAADILNLIGRLDVSIPLYLQYVSMKPKSGEIWFVLGRTELRKADQANSNPSLAAVYIERAIENGWTTWEAYSYLALAYYRTGQFDRVKEAVNKELKIVPNGEDALKWVKVIKDEEYRIKNAKQ